MRRRKVLLGLGSLAAGGAAATGTGAFTSFTGNRNASIPVVSDKGAFLAIRDTTSENSEYFDQADSVGGDTERATIRFGDDVSGSGFNYGVTFVDSLFKLANQSSQKQYVWIEEISPGRAASQHVAFYVGTGPSDGDKPRYACSARLNSDGDIDPGDAQPQQDDGVETHAIPLETGQAENIGMVVKFDRGWPEHADPANLLKKVVIHAVEDPDDLPGGPVGLAPAPPQS